jgi:two-component system OmpR family sensor kinase
MTLRARLLVVLGVLLATYAVVAVVIVSTQRSMLIDQVDRRLMAVPPALVTDLDRGGPPLTGEGESVPVVPGNGPESPLTDLYIGVAEADGSVSSILVGTGTERSPDVLQAVSISPEEGGIVTINAVGDATTYRAMVFSQDDPDRSVVVAASLAEVDGAMARLTRTLWIAGGIIAIVLGMAFFWIQRLGLRPIVQVTSVAEAIAAGDHSVRVAADDEHTEAGKLGHAFNLMLDERDAAEMRLRQFVADASHELRTPLTSVRGYLDLYQQGAFRKEGQLDDVVRRLSGEAARMYDLVEDLLVLASLDEGRETRREEVDIGEILRNAAQDARVMQPERPIDVLVAEDAQLVSGDEALLIQLVGILVANALAHTPQDARLVLSSAMDGPMVSVAIADSGPGLDAETASRVFDRFWRGESSRVRRGDGGQPASTGLGLAIARSIAESHGGSIAFQTAPGEGCRFTVRLPTSPE